MNDKEKQIEKMAYCLCTLPEKYGLPLSCEGCGNNGNCVKQKTAEELINKGYGDVRAAVKEFAEIVKMAFYYEFDELIPSIMADKIDELVKEMCENE